METQGGISHYEFILDFDVENQLLPKEMVTIA
jgi:hypothetical protein